MYHSFSCAWPVIFVFEEQIHFDEYLSISILIRWSTHVRFIGVYVHKHVRHAIDNNLQSKGFPSPCDLTVMSWSGKPVMRSRYIFVFAVFVLAHSSEHGRRPGTTMAIGPVVSLRLAPRCPALPPTMVVDEIGP